MNSRRRIRGLAGSILDSLSANVAVLDCDGIIIATNAAWDRFAEENGNPPRDSIGPNADYLAECRRAARRGDTHARAAAAGIKAVLAARRNSFELEYPCHSPVIRRWFLMNVSPLSGEGPGVVITHADISDRKLAETALENSEFTIRSLLESAPQTVIAVNSDEKIVFVNGNIKNMFGYDPAELVDRKLQILIPPPAREKHKSHHRSYFKHLQSRPMGIGLDLEALRKDGTTFPVEIGLSAIESSEGELAIAFVSDISERRRLEESAKTHAKEMQALAASLFTAQEEERRRVSRELHDQICQQLASLAIEMGGLGVEPSLPEDLQSRLKILQQRVVKVSDQTRHLAYELHSSVLDDLGLVASLQDLAQDFSRRSGIPVKLSHHSLSAKLPREIASCVYRVTQESLENISKHSQARHVGISLTIRRKIIRLLVTDDGVGFHPEAAKGRGGLGLIGMEERVRLVKGKLSITARLGHGTRIALEIPCPP